MPAVSRFAPTKNALIDGVLSGVKWTSPNITYALPTAANVYGRYVSETESFVSATPQLIAATRAALANFSAVSGLNFTELTSNQGTATLRLAMSAAPATAYAYMPSNDSAGLGGDIWFSSKGSYSKPVMGNYAYFTVLHEIGHALGLKHAHEAESGFAAMPSAYDAMEYTVMSYRAFQGSALTGYANETFGFAQTLMMADIAAIQTMYGADFETNATNSVYRFDPATGQMTINGVSQGVPGGNKIFRTVWDGGGTDTYDFANYATNQIISLAPGGFSVLSTLQLAKLGGGKVAQGNLYNALQFNGDSRSLIENAHGGSGNDSITGNQTGNILRGNVGNDALSGLGGADTLYGDAGNDVLDGGAEADNLSGGTGTDTLIGGLGADTMSGGDGLDMFVFKSVADSAPTTIGRDTITAFDALDIIDLRQIDANLAQTGDQAFGFVGTAVFRVQAAGQVRFVLSGNDTLIQIENNGNGVMDMEIRLTGWRSPITTADLLL